jgi:hypothetical protein
MNTDHNPIPIGVIIIRYTTLAFSMGLGWFAVIYGVLLGAGGAGTSQFLSDTAKNLSPLLFIAALLSFFAFLILEKPKKMIWYFSIGFWLFLLLSFISIIFSNDPFFRSFPYPITEFCLVPIIYSSVCLICFQTAKVKMYFHVKKT